MKIDIDKIFTDEFENLFVSNELNRIRGYMKEYAKRYESEDAGFMAIFSTDPEEDRVQVKKMIEALDFVLEYYGGPEYDI